MGSAIAQSMALRYPDRVERLVLSVPIAAADEFLQSLVGHLRRTCENDGARAYAMQSLLWTLAPENFNRMAPALRMLIDEKPPEVDIQGMRGQEAALCGFDLRDRAGDIGCPTLIVAAREDKVCPVYQAEALAGLIRGSQLVVVEGAGHLVQSEAPQAWSDAVLPFLRG
jgi:pimeloyl-ACP methyl ester carboxylesterase